MIVMVMAKVTLLSTMLMLSCDANRSNTLVVLRAVVLLCYGLNMSTGCLEDLYDNACVGCRSLCHMTLWMVLMPMQCV